MSNEVTVFNPKNDLPAEMASVFDADSLSGDLSEGATGGGFQVISIRGSKWRVKSGGEEYPVINTETDEPVASIEAIMLKANKSISKIWYAKKFTEGDTEAPDCFSVDGVAPDPSSANPQSKSCAACPHNQWGSRVTEAGKKAKACADSRRVAIMLMNNVPIEVDDEPMLLRVPAASLQDLATFGKKMSEKGYPYNAIITRIGFDVSAAYPKLTFKAMRPITNEEAAMVTEKFNSDTTHNILNTAPEMTTPTEEAAPAETKTDTVDTEFEEEATAPKPAAKKKGKKSAKKNPEPVAEVVEDANPAPTSGSTGAAADDDLDAILAELDALD